MSPLKEIEHTMQEAMKSGDKVKANTLKMLKTDIMYEKAKTGEDLSDEVTLEIIARAAKKRKEAIGEYNKAGRDELAAQEEAELAIIETYLPEMMSEEEVVKALDELIATMGAVSKKDFGRVMGTLMKDLKGKADGGLVKKVVTAKLSD